VPIRAFRGPTLFDEFIGLCARSDVRPVPNGLRPKGGEYIRVDSWDSLAKENSLAYAANAKWSPPTSTPDPAVRTGCALRMPARQEIRSFKQAPRAKPTNSDQAKLFRTESRPSGLRLRLEEDAER
jgi:hypothetical protein